jgi:hypothetical protein
MQRTWGGGFLGRVSRWFNEARRVLRLLYDICGMEGEGEVGVKG